MSTFLKGFLSQSMVLIQGRETDKHKAEIPEERKPHIGIIARSERRAIEDDDRGEGRIGDHAHKNRHTQEQEREMEFGLHMTLHNQHKSKDKSQIPARIKNTAQK